jgi:DNA polymerase III subunit gamma/tau
MAKRKATAAVDEAAPDAAKGYTVLARRYRPQQFRDLVGQEPVAQALVNALESNRVAHAYLFTGARGVGKTSTARILAKALNCVCGPTATPCDECEICQSIASGEDVDVLEIDAASNRGIDEVREIRQNVQYRPQRSRHKIYIIDEVHMLTAPAFNALLKTLEEPPPHVKFILATTEWQKIPVTILSRCQRFDFGGISGARIVERLRDIVTGEGLQADDDALELVARRAGGSMRDAQSLLDQLLAFGGERLTTEQVHRLLGTADDDRVAGLAAAVFDHDPKGALGLVKQAADEGLQMGELVDQLTDYWRDLMIVNCAGVEGQHLSVSAKHRDRLAQQAKAVSLDTILAGLDILQTTKARLRASSHGRVLVEMALVRLGRLDDLVSLAQVAQWLTQPQAAKTETAARPGTAPLASRPAANAAPPEAVKKKLTGDPDAPAVPLTADSLGSIWSQLAAQLPAFFGNALGKAGLPAISGPNTLVLRFPTSYNSEREYCQEPTRLTRLEQALQKLTGQKWVLRVETGAHGPASTPAPAAADQDGTPSRYRRQRLEAAQEPLVRRAMEVLGAQIVSVDDGFGSTPASAPERSDAAGSEEA